VAAGTPAWAQPGRLELRVIFEEVLGDEGSSLNGTPELVPVELGTVVVAAVAFSPGRTLGGAR
jgi:hypothetical protein